MRPKPQVAAAQERRVGARRERAMVVSEQEYRRLALDDGDRVWELHDGELVQKPPIAFAHGEVLEELGHVLRVQLGRERYRVRVNMGRVQHTSSYYVLDLFVLPIEMTAPYREAPEALEVYDRPLPLVVEAWSPSTGRYDMDEKLPEYQRRGGLEIWRLHPYGRTLIRWVREADGRYTETLHTGGMIRPVALLDVAIDLDVLFAAA